MTDELEIKDLKNPGFPKPPLIERGVARLVDFIIAGLLFFLSQPVGPVAAIVYLLIADGIKGGSFGKRFTGLKVVSVVREGEICDLRESFLRNAIFAVIVLAYIVVGIVPYVGKFVVLIAGIAVVVMEAVMSVNDESGFRFGDKISGTMTTTKDASLDTE
ncbi:MAG: RDD family protein [Deltaproteobacteria bacterium]|nr:RDD family protein [Deltaproteobacteria bacterium]